MAATTRQRGGRLQLREGGRTAPGLHRGASARAGGFEPLRFLPRGKRAVLGLVSSKSAELEDVSDLARRLDRASRFTPLDRLGIGPQCGFASTAGGNPITADVQRRKLAQVVAAARAVWGAEG